MAGSSPSLLVAGVALLAIAVPPAQAVEYHTAIGRFAVGGYVQGDAVIPTDDTSPRQRPGLLWNLELAYDPHRDVHIVVNTHTLVGGTPEHAGGFGVFNPSETFQNLSPSLEIDEAYADLQLGAFGVRVGAQKFAWGQLDRFQPTDVVNPRRYYDPFVTDEQDPRIAVPALSASYFPRATFLPPDGSLTFIWVPVPVPVRFPLPAERWFPPAIVTNRVRSFPPGSLRPHFPPHTVTAFDDFQVAERRPPQQLDEGSVAVRSTALVRGVDLALTYYDGVETAPDFDLTTSAMCGSRNLARCRLAPTFTLRTLSARSVLRPRLDRIRQAGGDAAFSFAGFTARVEGAFGMGRRLPRSADELIGRDTILRSIPALARQLPLGRRARIDVGSLFVPRDVIAWGVGLDYRYRGWLPLVQVDQTVVLRNHGLKLLTSDVDTRLMFVLRKSFLNDTLATELVAVQGLARSYSLGEIRATYALTDTLRLRAGYLFIAGSRNTLVGEYKANDEVFLQLRYAY